jgi:hypothetical protein
MKLDSNFQKSAVQPPSVSQSNDWTLMAALPDAGGAVAGVRHINDTQYTSILFLNPNLTIDATAPALHPNGDFRALATYRDTVYLYGSFTTLGPGMERNRIARFVRQSTITASKTRQVDAELAVWPNPSMERFTVSLPAGAAASQVRVCDVAGRSVPFSKRLNGNNLEISGLQPGWYLVSVPGVRPVRVIVQ